MYTVYWYRSTESAVLSGFYVYRMHSWGLSHTLGALSIHSQDHFSMSRTELRARKPQSIYFRALSESVHTTHETTFPRAAPSFGVRAQGHIQLGAER